MLPIVYYEIKGGIGKIELKIDKLQEVNREGNSGRGEIMCEMEVAKHLDGKSEKKFRCGRLWEREGLFMGKGGRKD